MSTKFSQFRYQSVRRGGVPTTMSIALLGIFVCLSTPSWAQSPNYVFTLENIKITKTRSVHNDTVHANFALKVGNKELQTLNRHMGDLNDGTYPVDLAFMDQISDPASPVLFNFQVVNKGHGGTTDQAIDKGLNEGAHYLAGALAGTGNVWAAGLTELFAWIGGFLNPNCDGPLAADQVSVTAAILKDWTAESGFHRETKYYPGIDSANGCGGNSQYYVTWTVIGTSKKVYGAIGQKWVALNGIKGPLGVPQSDELDAANGGRYNEFQNGFIFWTPQTNAHAVYGDIGKKWTELGRERGFGYPLTDEQEASGGRYNEFQNGGYIYWSPPTGAHAVYGLIAKKWVELGREKSALGFPTSDEEPAANGGRISKFQHGAIFWSQQTGAVVQ